MAEAKYVSAVSYTHLDVYKRQMSSVEKERKNATLNELINDAKQFFYEWIILKKKLVILSENERILEFMIKNAEIRYRNGLEKISAYYKAKACLLYTSRCV